MALTPLEIRKKTFPTVIRGFAPKEVRAFLAIVANELEELRKERALLAEKVDELSGKIANYEKTEKLLKETLLTAQKVANELRSAAEKDRMIIIEQLKQETEKLRQDIQELRNRRALIIDEIKAIANTYLVIAERFEKESYVRTETENSGECPSDKK